MSSRGLKGSHCGHAWTVKPFSMKYPSLPHHAWCSIVYLQESSLVLLLYGIDNWPSCYL